FVTSFVSATPEREGGVPADSITRSVVVPLVMSEAVITTHFASGPFATAPEPESEFEKQTGLLKSQDEKIENLKAQLLLKEAESTKVARLRTGVSTFEAAKQVHVDELNILKQKTWILRMRKC
nr:hypothetical protein [Tanacetum cinerariifolium]